MGDGQHAGRAKRLRVPAALVVAFAGSSAAISVWYGGCHDPADPSPDGGQIEMRDDAHAPVVDAGSGEEDAPSGMDAATTPDAPRDAAPPPDAPDH